MTKTQTIHMNGDWSETGDALDRYTACGQAAEEPRYNCSGDSAKVTCRRCLPKVAERDRRIAAAEVAR